MTYKNAKLCIPWAAGDKVDKVETVPMLTGTRTVTFR